MTCSSCSEPAIIVLADRAFCDGCYRVILRRQWMVIEEMPKRKAREESAQGAEAQKPK
jgi:hypothetical protein